MPIYRLITLLVGTLAIIVSNLFADELNCSDSRFADWELVMAEDSVPAMESGEDEAPDQRFYRSELVIP